MILPNIGGDGTLASEFITTLPEVADIHPRELVKVNVYVPGGISLIVIEVPEPAVFTFPGVLVIVQYPAAGKPARATLPVFTVQEGCVIVPIEGAAGASGGLFITTDSEG